MKYYTDLHIHSRFSRATSNTLDVHELARMAKIKGLGIIGTGDFSHPKWLAELKRDLKKDGETYERDGVFFIPTSEISLIYTKGGKHRRVHHLILAQDFEIVDQINEFLSRHGRLDYDGRPIFGMTSEDLMEGLLSISDDISVIPAHAWTPYFAIFGSKSGFDSVEECFGNFSKHIFALESGLSSDPAMNWRVSSLDRFSIVSFSDAHSASKLGRECCVFDIKRPSYKEIISTIKERDPKRFLTTIEFHPEEGKYHWDGHRDCGVVQSPKETMAKGDKCKVCGKPITIGVANRVEQLADRPEGFTPKDAVPFKSLVPLAELIGLAKNAGVATAKVQDVYNTLIARFGNEFAILLDAPENELLAVTNEKLANLILRNRAGKIKIKPGYDGVYGTPMLNESSAQTLGEFVK